MEKLLSQLSSSERHYSEIMIEAYEGLWEAIGNEIDQKIEFTDEGKEKYIKLCIEAGKDLANNYTLKENNKNVYNDDKILQLYHKQVNQAIIEDIFKNKGLKHPFEEIERKGKVFIDMIERDYPNICYKQEIKNE